jgi:hypothetical protein
LTKGWPPGERCWRVKLFAIVGMHRSGTSTVARILNLLGASLGPESDLMPAKVDNPAGFWESLSVTQLHDDLLYELGGRWDRPPLLEQGWESRTSLQPSLERIRTILGSHFAMQDIAAWKDPRGSIFLPLWRKVVPIAGTILCVRDPDEVAHSLAARSGMDAERAAALWLRYMVAAWKNGGADLLVRFDEAYEQPRELTRRLAAFAGLPSASDLVTQEIARFVDPSLRHYAEPQRAAEPLMRLARAAHALLTTQPPEVVTPFFSALSNGWRMEGVFAAEAAARAALRGEVTASVVEILKE